MENRFSLAKKNNKTNKALNKKRYKYGPPLNYPKYIRKNTKTSKKCFHPFFATRHNENF